MSTPLALQLSIEYNLADDSCVHFCQNLDTIERFIPSQEVELLPGVKWGHYCQLYTPAFWKFMYLTYSTYFDSTYHRLGSNVLEEVVACLLGGYGIPSELGMVAFSRLKEESLITPKVTLSEIKRALSTPFEFPDGSTRKYRFFNQKSQYIFSFLNRDDLDNIPCENDIDFRNWLLSVNGIGFKTASWITRNWFQSENVAILDIHILRAGKLAGFFEDVKDVSREYLVLESNFIEFCKALEVQPSNMDAIIWRYMKKTNKLAMQVLSSL